MTPARPPRTIHFTELPTSQPGSSLAVESETYRREVGRLLAEGLEGKYILIKGDQIIGIYDTREEAMAEGYRRYLGQDFLMHQIQTWERVIRIRTWL